MPEVMEMDALEAWNKAPAHIKLMAGQYVGPILAELKALEDRVEKLEGKVGTILAALKALDGEILKIKEEVKHAKS